MQYWQEFNSIEDIENQIKVGSFLLPIQILYNCWFHFQLYFLVVFFFWIRGNNCNTIYFIQQVFKAEITLSSKQRYVQISICAKIDRSDKNLRIMENELSMLEKELKMIVKILTLIHSSEIQLQQDQVLVVETLWTKISSSDLVTGYNVKWNMARVLIIDLVCQIYYVIRKGQFFAQC